MASNWGTKIGVLTPATNLTVESELRAMALPDVTTATARITFAQLKWEKPDDLRLFVEGVREQIIPTINRIKHVRPQVLLLGISISALWGGIAGNDKIKDAVKKETGLRLVTPVDGIKKAIETLKAKRIGVVTPYPEVADKRVEDFFTKDLKVEVLKQTSLRCGSPYAIGEVPPAKIAAAFQQACVAGVDAVVQLGTDLKTAAVAANAELWLGKPVLAINPTTWWHILREARITTKIPGWGPLLERY